MTKRATPRGLPAALFTFTCVIGLVCALALTAHAARSTVASGSCGSGVSWTLYDDGELAISGSGAMTGYDYGGAPWYARRSSIKTVSISAGVSFIGKSAFYGCDSMTGAIIPDSVSAIAEYAFYNCASLTGVTLPEGVSSIGAYAFFGCSSLTGVTVPASVSSIGDGAFRGCASLTAIDAVAGNANYKSVDGVLLTADGKTLVVSAPAGKRARIPSRTA